MGTADFLVYAQDLEVFELDDIENVLDDIGKSVRETGETAFPEVGRLLSPLNRLAYKRKGELERAKEAEILRLAHETRTLVHRIIDGVLAQTSLAGQKTRSVLYEVISGSLENPDVDPEALQRDIGDAWKEYSASMQDLEVTLGAERFFGDAVWKNKAAWRWKEGKGPQPPKVEWVEASPEEWLGGRPLA